MAASAKDLRMRNFSRFLVNALLGLVLASPLAAHAALKCDVDNNGRIDKVDLGLIQSAIQAGAPATGPDDPRDADNNGLINSGDGRICALRCKYAQCATNGVPVANAGADQTARVGDSVTLSAALSSDPDGDTLSYRWTLVTRPAGSIAALSSSGAVAPSLVIDRPGSYVAELVVSDGKLSSTVDSVTVSTVNSAPVANAGPDQSARVGEVVVLDGRASSDVDGDPLSHAWRLVAAPVGSTASLDNASLVQPRLTLDKAGSYVFELVVNDGRLNSAADTIHVSTINSAPVARPGANRSVALGARVVLDGSGSTDVDGDPLSFAWSLLSRPAGSSAALSSASAVKPEFVADKPGSYVVQLIVNDGLVDSPAATVTLSTDNAAPTANAGPDQTVALGAPVLLDGRASLDPEGAPLSYAWSLTSRPAGSTAALDNATLASPGFMADKPGNYVVQLIVSDGSLNSAPDTVVISTSNSRPVADAGAAQSVATGSAVALDGSASRDADGDALRYAWSLTTKPVGSTAAITPADAVRPGFTADKDGVYVAQLIVSDAALASVPATVSITASTSNQAPTAVATATPASVAVGASVALSAAGSADPEGTPLSYAWSVAIRPSGSVATVSNADSANASFVPDLPGSYSLQLTVSDGALTGSALAGITASASNSAPSFNSSPVTTASIGVPYVYAASATDPDAGDTLSFSLAAAPSGMVIDAPTGVIRWTPTPAQQGSAAVTVRVSDAGGLSATQSFNITVSSAPAPLQLAASLSPAVANAGQSVTLTVLVSGGNGGAVTRSATLDGAALTLDAAGVATFIAPAAGTHTIDVRAEQAAVGGGAPAVQTRQLLLTVRDPGDVTPPSAAITSPAADSEVLTSVPVTGTATDARFAYYQLLLRPAGAPDSAWVEIHRGLAPVTNGTLGTIDPSTRANGLYELGLKVVDVNGQATSVVLPFAIARDRKLGAFRLSFTDIHADASGTPLLLTRTYDSLKKDVSSDFGYGWSMAAQDFSVRKNMVFGLQWTVVRSGPFNLCLRPVGSRRVTVSLPDGGIYRFQARNEPECAFAQVPALNVVLDPLPLPVGGGRAASAGVGQLSVVVTDTVLASGGHLFNVDTGEPWNPTDFDFTDALGVKYRLREGVGVLSTTDLYGNTVTYGAGGISHSSSLAVSLTRDAQGRITRATDPLGRHITYTYNAAGDLASMTDRLGQVTYFQYDTVTRPAGPGDSGSVNSGHLLASITDPRGVVVTRQQFDERGRLVGLADANGVAATQSFDDIGNQQRVVDRRGNATVYSFDAAGNVTRIVDAKGGVTEITYDANGNELTRRDPLGHVTSKTFDPATGSPLTETDALGRTTTTAYASGGAAHERQNAVSVTDPMGRVRNYAYGGSEKIPGATPRTITEPLGRTTSIGISSSGNLSAVTMGGLTLSYSYDAKGRRTRETDGLGNFTSYTFDDNGNELTRSVTRTVAGLPRVETTTRTYDAANRVTQETDATGAVRRYAYDAAGKLDTVTDALGRVTRNFYDGNARLIRTEYPDGSNERWTHDANGNQVSATDRQGRTTLMVYDELDRLAQTTYPDGAVSSREYDAAGRLTAEIDELGVRRFHEYDAGNQLTATTDGSGRRTQHGYDLAGNRIQTQLPDGRSINYSYDALNRLISTTYPDGSSFSATLRPDGRKVTQTDARGVVTSYGYDAAGRLTSAQQSGIGAATTYAYDETGTKIAQKDALSRTVQWRHDAAGRPVGRILPDGSSESFSYDAAGQLISQTTFGGQTITRTYDSQGREISRNIPASGGTPARSISWTYNADGQRATQTETGASSTQGTTIYSYDAVGRLTQLSGPLGTLSWSYDAAGRITQRGTPEGSTNYSYDPDGRLSRLVAPDGRAVSYTYDAAGRMVRSEQELASGIALVTDLRHDAQDREVAIAHSKRSGAGTQLIAGQAISRGVGGAVNRIDTFDTTASFDAGNGSYTGTPVRVQTFSYDANSRLSTEHSYKGSQLTAWLADSSQPATQAIAYGYDDVGNRTAKSVVTPGSTTNTTYAYDSNDRLITETIATIGGGISTINYSWDGNGNLASKQSATEFTGYRFDADSRLIEVRRGASAGSASVVASYAYDADGARVSRTTPAGTTKYLIDPNTTWPQVVLESTGAQRLAYVWGDVLKQQTRGTAGSLFTSPSEALIPLAGHQGTPMAAIDRSGALVESTETTAYGELANNTPRLNHQYTGEYWDPAAELHYLRARVLDARTGRFLSLDRAMGQATDPKTQHRYAYVGADPVNQRDPSGHMTLSMGGLGVSFSISSTLAQAAIGLSLGAIIYPYADAAVRSTIWDVMVLMKVSGDVSKEVTDKMAAAKEKADKKKHKGPEAHHTIPVYLCGHPGQVPLSLVSYSEHQQLHAGLSAVALSIEAAGDGAADTLNIPFGRRRKPVIQALGKSQVGRGAIAAAIQGFYVGTAAGEFGAPPVLTAFGMVKAPFVGGQTSCMP